VGWIALRAAWRGWPLLVAPTTDEVCARLLAAEPPRPPGGAASAITHAECVALVERRLQRRGALAGAALRHCLGTATSVEIAVMCR
jgi:hypothetical protein